MKRLKLFKAFNFDDKEWDEVESEYDSNLEREFEEISDYFLEISDDHPQIRFISKNSEIKLYDIDNKTEAFKEFIKNFQGYLEVFFNFNGLDYDQFISLLNNIKSPIKKMSNWNIRSIEPNWSVNQNGWNQNGWIKIGFFKK